jgi:hypothetical protein
MRKLNRLLVSVLIVGLVLTAAHVISAQQRGGARGQGPQQGRRFDPEQMMERMMERIMERLNLAEDEASVLKPRIEGIIRTRQEQSTEIRELTDALQEAIDAKDAGQIKAKLDEVKAKRKEHKAKSEAMEKELTELLTVEQEANLTVLGVVNSDGFGFRFGGGRGQGMQRRPGGSGG